MHCKSPRVSEDEYYIFECYLLFIYLILNKEAFIRLDIVFITTKEKKLILPARLDYASVCLLENTGRISESVPSGLLFIEQQLCSGRSRSQLRFFSACVSVTVGSITQKVKSDVASV